jgi:hypothetical protein
MDASKTTDLPEMTPPTKESSQIAKVGHRDGHLYVTFKSFRPGAPESTYRYAPKDGALPHEHHHAQILAAESAGGYVNAHVKKAGYTYEKLS